LIGLTGVIRGFGSVGNPMLCLDGLFEIMVGSQSIELMTMEVGARNLN
jgi:hypothetical protein